MTLLYYDPSFLDHDTGTHPERAERLRQVMRHLERTGLDKKCTRPQWKPATEERLARVHDLEYVKQVSVFADQGGGRIEADTVVSRESYRVALKACGAACDAVDWVLADKARNALCLIRPPGHHALRDDAMGFCLFNHVAVAARVATQEHKLRRVLIIDWDVHHGNGTQDAFYEDELVAFLSIHRWPFYPGTGDADETGRGRGLGTKVNLPVPFGTARSDYLGQFRNALEKLADRMKPELVLISAGFDSHRDDPIGSLGLEIEDFKSLSQIVLDVAATHAKKRVVSLLEGGYNPGILAGSVELHLQELLDRDPTAAAEKPSPG